MKTELVTTLKRQATRLLAELKETGEPVLITEHGKPSAYLVNVESYEALQGKMRILEGIARGERALLENRTYTETEARQQMARWLGWPTDSALVS